MFKLCTNKNHSVSCKHNEQINSQNIDNSGIGFFFHVAILLATYCTSSFQEYIVYNKYENVNIMSY
jgi:hypothetical protein